MTTTDLPSKMAAAVREVHREVTKAALVPSVADGALVALALNILLRITGFPDANPDLSLAFLPGVEAASIHVAVPVALAAGTLVAVVEYRYRMRTTAVEQFESVNPDVAEALRTARDTLDDGGDGETPSPMARRLYGDVLTKLQSASSVELLPTRRVVFSVLGVLVLSIASIQVAIVDLDLGGIGGSAGTSIGERDADRDADLQNGSAILGDPEDVSAGNNEVNATLSGTNSGEDTPDSQAEAYDSTGFTGDRSVESQRAGYLSDDTLDEAELIRDYTLKIRDKDEDDE
ncbi:hypothetical protein ACFQJC_10835 [Haloferax namakaokahaiae]|uniref:Uncharacterized protein n=1 Tax=Haloferax namakaokahaiae TaxID=1748331 RepID=A0ABD5ZG64_9EURY